MWGVAQLKPVLGSAELAITNLVRQGFEAFNPTFNERRVVRNKVRLEPRQVFSGYLFVGIRHDQRWSPINSTYGIARLITRKSSSSEYHEPSPIPDVFITRLKACSNRNAEHSWCLMPGTRIRIVHGPLMNHNAVVTWSDQQRVRLLLEILGRDDVVVTVSVEDVIAI